MTVSPAVRRGREFGAQETFVSWRGSLFATESVHAQSPRWTRANEDTASIARLHETIIELPIMGICARGFASFETVREFKAR
jgi:hypothetical protein